VSTLSLDSLAVTASDTWLNAPVQVNWPHVIKQRKQVMRQTDLPFYLLAPEISDLLRLCKDSNQRLMFATAFLTGGELHELMALKRSHFDFDADIAKVTISSGNKERRASNDYQRLQMRNVPIADPYYIDMLQSYFKTHKVKKNDRLFEITRFGANKRLQRLIVKAESQGFQFDDKVSFRTFRHSFAINLVLHGRPLPFIQKLLGHSMEVSTAIYGHVLDVEADSLISGVCFNIY